jgi:hypothetical protein
MSLQGPTGGPEAGKTYTIGHNGYEYPMISSTMWARRVLSPATLYLVIVTLLYRCVTKPVAVADRWLMMLASGCSRTVA